MRIDFTVGVYLARKDGEEQWTALVPGSYFSFVSGQGEAKLRERMIDRLRSVLRSAPPVDQELFQLVLGTELVHLPVDVKLVHGRLHGTIPLVVEPRWTGDQRQHYIVYHPLFRAAWFVVAERDELPIVLPTFLREHFDVLSEADLALFTTDGKDRLVPLAFSAEPLSLLDMLPSRRKDARAAASAARSEPVLRDLGIDETRRRCTLEVVTSGVRRSPYRERLASLMSGPRPRSAVVVGPSGSGKTTLIEQWVMDRAVEDGYPIHRNLDKVHHVWRLSGKRIIAGMAYLGQWEERCLAILEDTRNNRAILWIEDLHLFGQLGQSRQSERSFADFFRGPVRRGDLAIVAELTLEQFAKLEREAPGLAEALALVTLPAASAAETSTLMLATTRDLEAASAIEFDPYCARTVLELGSALFPWRARPGVALDILRRLAHQAEATEQRVPITPEDVLHDLARVTGLSPKLLSLDAPLDPADVEATFAARVIGQPAATKAATDVVLRVRAGLADPHRPVNVMLFTGPTGTGKTELATAIAEYLYGGGERLLRIDMGELTGADSVARLIGAGGGGPYGEGILTSGVRAQPFCVVLLDEIEKAHPQALHLLLQLFDEGRLTDANGEVASFASAVVIMTSNLGSKTAAPIGFGETRDRILADVAKAVRQFFPIELFNRIDQVVPFEPLTPEVAEKIVDKELAKLLSRRGLRERNTFVYAGAAVRRRAVADAFDARYGARTVKRWLEDKVGGSLTDLLAGASPARLRIVRLAEHAGAITATLEPLHERAPAPGPYVLEGALDLATAALEPAIAVAGAALGRIARSTRLADARATATAELRYYVDELELRLTALGETLGVSVDSLRAHAVPEPEDRDDDEPAYDEHIVRSSSGRGTVVRTRTRRGSGRPTRPLASRDALIGAVAETLLIERSLPELLDPDAHAITIVVSRIGATADADGLSLVAVELARGPWFDAAAGADNTGEVRKQKQGDVRLATVAGTTTFVQRARDFVIQLRGLFVRRAFDGEHGTWMIRGASTEPDVIRVEVRSGITATAEQVVRAHLAARAEFDRVLDQGGPLPTNPDALLPVTRTVAYRPPLRPGDSYHFEIEDFATGWSDRGPYRDTETALRRVWHLAWSRQV